MDAKAEVQQLDQLGTLCLLLCDPPSCAGLVGL
ncbi:hypothetical protein HaLaN_18548 [Haematococcus lacustris]|uniref:Uncharacterized protein n=1 Tax=Haematococcus lacustris TaxID=44745 RepID=A0A699ZJN8_HAELA|nr:hypothetical protein HaLaN_18548 [Haematococcus lacustris]